MTTECFPGPTPHPTPKRLKSKKEKILFSSSETVVFAYDHSFGDTEKRQENQKFKLGTARILLKSSQELAMLQPLIPARGRQRQSDL